MPKKRFSAEQVVTMLRQIEVATSQGKSIGVACREAGISDQSYFLWRKEYGGLDLDQARRMKELEKENARLKRLSDTSDPLSFMREYHVTLSTSLYCAVDAKKYVIGPSGNIAGDCTKSF